jgi:hypothetical protein
VKDATGRERTVDQTNLRDLFEQVLDTEPAPPPGDLAQTAMAQGTRMRRRRGLIAGGGGAGVVAVIAVLALNLTGGSPSEPAPRMAVAVMLAPTRGGCTAAVQKSAAEVSIFLLNGVTARQRQELGAALAADPLVRSRTFESREQAYARFKVLWKDSPDLVKAVRPDLMPESFRIRLVEPTTYMAFVGEFRHRAGVDQIVGDSCAAPSAPSGEGE